MGIGDTIRNAITPDFVKKIETGLTPAAPPEVPAPATETTTPQQKAYEAKEKAVNANNPSYSVPRAKGGPVKAGGCLANGGPVKKGGALWNGQPVKKC
jgi:hypothetical protein